MNLKNNDIVYKIPIPNDSHTNHLNLPHVITHIYSSVYIDGMMVNEYRSVSLEDFKKNGYIFNNKKEALAKKIELLEESRILHIEYINQMIDKDIEDVYFEDTAIGDKLLSNS